MDGIMALVADILIVLLPLGLHPDKINKGRNQVTVTCARFGLTVLSSCDRWSVSLCTSHTGSRLPLLGVLL